MSVLGSPESQKCLSKMTVYISVDSVGETTLMNQFTPNSINKISQLMGQYTECSTKTDRFYTLIKNYVNAKWRFFTKTVYMLHYNYM